MSWMEQVGSKGWITALGLLTLGAPAEAQTLRYTFEGDLFYDLFGFSVDGGGDVNGDGYPDVIGGGYRGSGFMGRVKVHSGFDGALLYHFIGDTSDQLGLRVRFAGDLNADGHEDFMTIYDTGTRIWSGIDGAVLYDWSQRTTYPYGDFDQDGHSDLIRMNSLISGADGSVLRTLASEGCHARAGDVDGDGLDDYLRILFSSPGQFVRAHSMADNSVLLEIDTAGLGADHAAGLGDVDGDGHADLAVGLYMTNELRVYSGLTGEVLYGVEGGAHSFATEYVSPMADVDGDGADDFLTGYPTPALRSGRDGSVLAWFDAPHQGLWEIAAAGDTDGDGLEDVVIGDPIGQGSPNSAGRVRLFSFDGVLGTRFCASTPNSTGFAAQILAVGSASFSANDLQLQAGPLPAVQQGLFFYGAAQAQLPFGNGFRCVTSGGAGVFRLPLTVASSGGLLATRIDNTQPPSSGAALVPGSTWNFQAWYRDPSAGGAAFDLSDGVQISFVP